MIYEEAKEKIFLGTVRIKMSVCVRESAVGEY